MEKRTEKTITEFMEKIKLKYPDINIGYDYYEEDGTYDIWHDNEYLEYEDKEFPKFIGILIQEMFYDEKIFNFSFGFDYEKVNYSYVESDNTEKKAKFQITTAEAIEEHSSSVMSSVEHQRLNAKTSSDQDLTYNLLADNVILFEQKYEIDLLDCA